ncbi:helix-turn-helix transcriptional regulator [Paenibacillus oceani]|uniref:Helix-turn-helix transcriptional regulator n=1 Tax=Paenibacillus oceani TaxID=2772510 RepID=A0A927H085_9BACL|nr:AraC family transcriptional regulator [Paenibacillus oceani]MBD2862204.1 helix-turn-helix transcriptional regulator [Paenibacillus oceani]
MIPHSYCIFDHFYYKWNKLLAGQVLVHSHVQYEIYYFHGGRCDYVLGDRTIPLQPGDLIIMNGLTPHCPKVDRSAEYVRTMFSFDPHLVQLFGHNLLACNPLKPFETLRNHHIRLSTATKTECEDILSRINRYYYSEDPVHRNRLLAAFYDLLMLIYELCRGEMESARNGVSDWERYVQQIVAYIEEKYMEDIGLDRMASELHMNRFHMMKVFREVTGMTVFDYLFKRRIDQAKLMFHHCPDDSVTDVCYKSGFKHPSHFSRVFKKQVGTAPDPYRKQIREFPFS